MRWTLMLGLLFLLPVLPVRAADEPDPEPVPADIRKLQGEWDFIRLGAGPKFKDIKGVFMLKLEKKQMTIMVKGQPRIGTWKIDARKNPKHIDLNPNIFAGTACIYKLDKDELTIACNNGGNDRPKDFATAGLIMILKRKKK
jgi:uncharacterized protein (TIGR03067 family)